MFRPSAGGSRPPTSAHLVPNPRSVSRRVALRGLAAAPAIGVALRELRTSRAHDATPATGTEAETAGLVDIGGRSLYLHCTGSGSPTVVFVTGYRDTSDIWSIDQRFPDNPRAMVLQPIAGVTRVCAYDRPGTATSLGDADLISRSDAVPQPRTALDLVDELHALIQAAGIETPIVLASHSLGGALARLYTSAYPEEVAGLVLIDAYNEFIEALMTPDQWAALSAFNRELGTDTVVPIPDYGDIETIPYGSMNPELRETAPLGNIPLAVLAHGVPFEIDTVPDGFTSSAELEGYLTAANEQLAPLTSDARYWVGETSGHYVQQDQPELVVEAIRQVVAGVRNPDTWTSLADCCES
jgi:pimeloyl-ACP methyl ester carboxylesterase